MDMDACIQALRAKVGNDSGLNATLKFDCGADGVAFIDGRFKVSGDMSVALKLQRVV